jgi:hypothetical protein
VRDRIRSTDCGGRHQPSVTRITVQSRESAQSIETLYHWRRTVVFQFHLHATPQPPGAPSTWPSMSLNNTRNGCEPLLSLNRTRRRRGSRPWSISLTSRESCCTRWQKLNLKSTLTRRPKVRLRLGSREGAVRLVTSDLPLIAAEVASWILLWSASSAYVSRIK